MLHLQTSNQSPVTLQFRILSLAALLVVAVVDVAAAISLNTTGYILGFTNPFDI
jgi:hypothetical protein